MLSPRASQNLYTKLATPRMGKKRPASALVRDRPGTLDFNESKHIKSTKPELKKKWIEEIVRNRIYSEDELDKIFRQEVNRNRAMSYEDMKEVWNEVLSEINPI